jgi:two-component system, OmpR family, KDP operon response regulator KdpE
LKRLLVVDDEPQITRMLRASLQSSGYEVLIANNGTQAYARLIADRPDLVITDLAMPEMNGIELTQAIRGASQIPIIVLSVRDSDQMKVLALDEGADDYLTKPFSVPELLARVRAQLRRGVESQAVQAHIELGDFVIDTEAHSVLIRNQPVHLTPKEFDLLVVFARSPERVLTHKVLLRAVWGPAGDGQPEYLRVLIAQLRKKIEPAGSPQYILSEPWIGYRFDPSGPASLTTS